MTDHWTRREFGMALGALSANAMLGGALPGKDSLPFKLGVITDEITQNFEQALDFIASFSLSYCELRQLWGRNIMSLSQAELDRAKQMTFPIVRTLNLLRHLFVNVLGGAGIFNLLPITYAFQP